MGMSMNIACLKLSKCVGTTASLTMVAALIFHSPPRTLALGPVLPLAQGILSPSIEKGHSMTIHAHGPFDVNVIPQPPADESDGSTLGRMLLDKHFHGDLEAASKGQMLTGMTAVKGSGAYVAIERVTGTLHGRSGSFILQHLGLMVRGVPQLQVAVVPDSGTGALTGIEGTMNILIADGKHSYDFAYSLPHAH
jgi:Protein of unknown function (DUF3224)